MISLGLLYWLVLIIALIFSFIGYGWPITNWRPVGYSLIIWILLVILGVAVFGFPIAMHK